MFSKGPASGICFCSGSNPCRSEDTHKEELSSSWEKDEYNLHEEEENIFDDDEDNTITVSG